MTRLALLGTVVAAAALAEEAPRVEQREATEPANVEHRFELVLYPVVPQLNATYTQHLGTFGALAWHAGERIAVQLTGGYNWHATESSFTTELADRVRAEPQPAQSLLSTWNAVLALELSPISVAFSVLDRVTSRFDFGVLVGAGIAGARVTLRPAHAAADGTWVAGSTGDVGPRAVGAFGVAAHLRLGQHFAVRLELRDLVSSSRVDRVNGCSAADLHALSGTFEPLGAGSYRVSGSCDVSSFRGPETRWDAPVAWTKVLNASSDVMHRFGLYAGVAFLF